MIRRRELATLAAGSLIAQRAAALNIPIGRQINCKIMRLGSNIGTASYRFDKVGDLLVVAIDVEIRVRLGFVTLFRYSHVNTEHWRGEQLVQFASRTDDNGAPNFATATWNGTGLKVTGSKTDPYVAPPTALGSSYWNPRTLRDPLINAQNGKLLNIRMQDAGPSQAVLSTGKTVAATEYKMTGDMHVNIWFDAALNWAGLQYFARDGSILTYEKNEG